MQVLENNEGLTGDVMAATSLTSSHPHLYLPHHFTRQSTNNSPRTTVNLISTVRKNCSSNPIRFTMPFRVPAVGFAPRISTVTRRTFATTPRTLLNEVGNRSGEELEQKKQEQLKKQEKGEGHWHEELASQSEAKIAADKESAQVKDHDKHMRELQQETAKKGEKGELSVS